VAVLPQFYKCIQERGEDNQECKFLKRTYRCGNTIAVSEKKAI
jgi:hypothetical protein